MAAMLQLVKSLLNSLLPFTNPNTPLLRDIVHATVLIAVFYYGPTLMERLKQSQRRASRRTDRPQPVHNVGEREPVQEREIPRGNDEQEIGEPTDEDDMEDLEDEDLEQEGFENLPDDAGDAGDAGPAQPNPHQPPPRRDPSRPIGKKKAAAIARRDRRRAYNEFMRSQGDAQRAKDAEEEAEREEAVLEEKRRRAVIEMELEKRAKEERDEEKRRVEGERRREWSRREDIVRRAREAVHGRGYVELRQIGDREEVEGLVRGSGILGTRKNESTGEKEVTLLTKAGWLVRVDEGIMKQLYQSALEAESGRVSFDELGVTLEKLVKARSTR